MMMMSRRKSKPGERDVGGSEMGVGLMQRFDSLPNSRSVIRTKNWFSYTPIFSPHAKEHHGIPIFPSKRQQTRGIFLDPCCLFLREIEIHMRGLGMKHNLVAVLDARQILFPSTCIWNTKRYSKPTAFNALCTLVSPQIQQSASKSWSQKRRLPQHLGCPNIPPKLASQQLCCWRSQHLLPGSLGEMLLSKHPEMPLNDKSCWWYCTLYIFCIRLLLQHVG